MSKNREGLNYIPLLTQNFSPPCSGRSRMSLNKIRNQQSIIYYNGNYEGDSSMFKDKGFELDRLSLVDTESDTEFQNETSTPRSTFTLNEKATRENSSLAVRVLQFCILHLLKPEWREKISYNIEKFKDTTFYNKLAKCLIFLTVLWTYIFYLAQLLCYRFFSLGHFLWRKRVILRHLLRRLLWWLILAKCNDLSLFLLILISLPLLFILALFGVIISFCGGLRDVLHQRGYLMKKI